MGIKKQYTLKALFRRFTMGLITTLVSIVSIVFCMESILVSMGLATSANQVELQVKELVPILATAPDLTKISMPQGCTYLILDKEFHELAGNMEQGDKEAAVLYARGEYADRGDKRQFTLIDRENEICILQYYIGSQFLIPWLPDFFPSPDTLTIIFMIVGLFLAIILLTAEFAKNLRLQLTPLFEATEEVSKQNLDFEVGHSKVKEFEEALQSFSNMKECLKTSLEQQWKAEQQKREQIGALAHDIKTPLTIIQGNADLISETRLDAEQRSYVNYISESSGQIQLYLKTLIEIARTSEGYQFYQEEIDVRSYMNQLAEKIKALCRTRGILLQMEMEHLPSCMMGDKLLLERAIMNVVNNALDYSPDGAAISIRAAADAGCLKMSVTDEGMGFSSEDLLHAQEQFYMADPSRGEKLHFGMGLYIANSILEQHGGKLILANSQESGGAEVTLEIPIVGTGKSA